MHTPNSNSWKSYIAIAASTLALAGCGEDEKPKIMTQWAPAPTEAPLPPAESQNPEVAPLITATVTAISQEAQEIQRGMQMAQAIISRRPKSPADFPADIPTPEKEYVRDEVEDLQGDIKVKDQDENYQRSLENKKANDLFKEVQALVNKSTDTLTMKGAIASPGKKRLMIRYCSGECSQDITIHYGDESVSANQYTNGTQQNIAFDYSDEMKVPAKRKAMYEKIIAMLQEVKWVLQNPTKVTPTYMVVKTVPATVKNFGANLKDYPSAQAVKIGVVRPNTLVQVLHIDPKTGYVYIAQGGYIAKGFLDPYDAKNFHPESFGANKVKVRRNSEVEENGGLNFRDENGNVIGKIPADTELDLLALDCGEGDCSALVQYRDPADARLKTGYLVATEFTRGRMYLDGIQ